MLRRASGEVVRSEVDRTVDRLRGMLIGVSIEEGLPVQLVDQIRHEDSDEWATNDSRPADLLGSWYEVDGSATAEVRLARPSGGCDETSYITRSIPLDSQRRRHDEIGIVVLRQTVLPVDAEVQLTSWEEFSARPR